MSDLKLHPYQVVARDHLLRNDQACLFLDMGLGKTATTLSALTPEHLPALVVAPKRVAETVWPLEKDLWRPDLTMTVVKGSKAARARLLSERKDITVIGRDNLRDIVASTRAKDAPFKTLIIDELSGFKTRRSIRWRAARSIVNKHGIVYRWGLTGTPAPNGLMDLWGQMALIDDGERLGRRLTDYRNRYFIAGDRLPSGVVTRWDLKPEADKRIHAKVEDICLSMETDGRIELPPVTINPVTVELPPKVRKIYKDFKADLVADLTMLGGWTHSAKNAAALSNSLSQISAGFIYTNPDDPDAPDGAYTGLHREKIKAVEEIVEGTGSPVLVFYRYAVERELLLEALPQARTIDEPDVIAAWNAGEVPVLIAHPQSAGHGLNLQHGGHTICWTSLPWSLEEWQQSNKRLARQGQKHAVVIHVLLAKGTIDARILRVLEGKADVQQALTDHLESVL